MKNNEENIDICLFVLGLEYSSRTDVEITIQYGAIILRKDDIIVQLLGSLDSENIKEILIPAAINKFNVCIRRIWVPYSIFNHSDILFDYLDAIFKPLLKEDDFALVSISPKVYSALKNVAVIFLDKFLTISASQKFNVFSICKRRKKYYLSILVNGKPTIEKHILLIIRSGIGNDDL